MKLSALEVSLQKGILELHSPSLQVRVGLPSIAKNPGEEELQRKETLEPSGNMVLSVN